MTRIPPILISIVLSAACTLDEQVDPGAPGGEGDPAAAELAPTYPTQHPRMYLGPNRARLAAALTAGAPSATRFRAAVDRWLGGASIWGFGAWNGALLSQLTGNAAYCTKAVSTIEAQVAAAESAIASGGRPAVASDSYLGVGDMIGDLALVYDWCFSQVTSSQRSRWIAYANQAVWNVWNHSSAQWGGRSFPWTGWSVNNPSNNYYYSFLRATMLLGLATRGESSQADAWLTKFRDEKILGQLVPRFEADLAGGGSREGTGYGMSMRRLFELYEIWQATTGEDLATLTGHARSSMVAFMHQTLPTLDRIAPTGDHSRDATASYFDYHRAFLLQLMRIFPSSPLAGRGKSLLAASSVPMMANGFMYVYDFLDDPAPISALPLDGLNTAYHARGIGQLYARSGWDKGATWVNLIAGPYTESHAHQDQGSIMVFKGEWLAYDANVQSRSGLAQKTTAHSLVRIDVSGTPARQIASTISGLVALKKGPGYVYAAADLTPAYKGNTAIQKVQRELMYLTPDVAVVFDRVQTSGATTQTWQLASPVAPSISGASATFTNGGHSLRVTRVAPSSAAMSVYNYTSDSDFKGGYRLDERLPGGDQRYLHVLAADGAVSSVALNGATGVTLSFAAGGSATVNFVRDSVGATLNRGGIITTFGPGVDTLPE